MKLLADVKVLVALGWPQHPHHAAAEGARLITLDAGIPGAVLF